jgi:RF-1 domain
VRRDELIGLADAALLAQCEVDRLRGPGPGGQKRNKTESAIRLRHGATGLAAMAGESRSQPENKARALRRLRERIAFDLRQRIELDDYQPPAGLAALLDQDPVRKSEKWLRSADYLRAVGELIDLYQAVGCSLADAARRAGVSQNRLDRIVRVDPRLARKLGELKTALRGRPAV